MIRIKREKSRLKDIGFWGVFCNGSISFGFCLYWIDIDFNWHAKDWMIKTDEELKLDDGRVFVTYEKNPKYENQKVWSFVFP